MSRAELDGALRRMGRSATLADLPPPPPATRRTSRQVAGLGWAVVVWLAVGQFLHLGEQLDTTITQTVFITGVVVVATSGRSRPGVAVLGWRALPWPVVRQTYAWGLFLALVSSGVFAVAAGAAGFHGDETPLADGPLAVAVVSLVVLGPVAEETVFRGLLIGAVLPRVGAWAAIGLSAVLFSVAHLATANAASAPIALGSGLVLGWLRVRTGSILTGVLVHGTTNLAVVENLTVGPAIAVVTVCAATVPLVLELVHAVVKPMPLPVPVEHGGDRAHGERPRR